MINCVCFTPIFNKLQVCKMYTLPRIAEIDCLINEKTTCFVFFNNSNECQWAAIKNRSEFYFGVEQQCFDYR
jgi:hypothetical protein